MTFPWPSGGFAEPPGGFRNLIPCGQWTAQCCTSGPGWECVCAEDCRCGCEECACRDDLRGEAAGLEAETLFSASDWRQVLARIGRRPHRQELTRLIRDMALYGDVPPRVAAGLLFGSGDQPGILDIYGAETLCR